MEAAPVIREPIVPPVRATTPAPVLAACPPAARAIAPAPARTAVPPISFAAPIASGTNGKGLMVNSKGSWDSLFC